MESIINFRPLKHFKTKDNATIKENKIFRSAAPEYGTAQDFNKLSELQLDNIIDFRAEHEKDASVQNQFNQQFHRQDISIDVANFFSPDKANTIHIDKNNIDHYYQTIYQSLPVAHLQHYQTLMQNFNQGKTLLFHCTAGKDRTGFAAYLVLSALNVHLDDIMEDYLLSNQSAIKLYESRKNDHNNKLLTENISMEVVQQLFGVKEEYLQSAIQTIEEGYQNINHYLQKNLMADTDLIQKYYLE